MKKLKTGPILKNVCDELGYNNRQIAELLSVTASNVGRIYKQDNVNTDTLDKLTEKLGVNIYRYLANEWESMAKGDPNFKLKEPEGVYFTHVPKFGTEENPVAKPKISILIEIDPDKQAEIIKLLNL